MTTQESSSGRMVLRILESPELVSTVAALEPSALGRVIQHVGLEDCAELVSLMSTAQLQDVFDDDLWRAADPTEGEAFDPARFALWLELMLEAGDRWVADRLTHLSEDLVVFAFHSLVIVLSLEEMVLTAGTRSKEDQERIDAALERCPSEDLGDYLVVARREEDWDPVFAGLLALDRHHHRFLVSLLERCAALALDEVEESGGLVEVLTRHQSMAEDVRVDRDDRRRRRGYVSSEDANAFLAEARSTDLEALESGRGDGMFRAYRRQLDPAPPLDAAQLVEALRAAGVGEAAVPRGLPSGAGPSPFERAMTELRDRDPELYDTRTEEVAFLANVLLSAGDGPVRNVDAARTALEHINRGMAHLGVDQVETHSAVQMFRIGIHLAAEHPG